MSFWCDCIALWADYLIWNPRFILNVSIGVFYTVTLSYLFLSSVELLWQSFLISVILSYDSVFRENVTGAFQYFIHQRPFCCFSYFCISVILFLSQRILFFLSFFFHSTLFLFDTVFCYIYLGVLIKIVPAIKSLSPGNPFAQSADLCPYFWSTDFAFLSIWRLERLGTLLHCWWEF